MPTARCGCRTGTGSIVGRPFESCRKAAESADKSKLIVAGLTNEVCIAIPTISAVAAGFAAQWVADGGGWRDTQACW